jgi:hypothetical protein
MLRQPLLLPLHLALRHPIHDPVDISDESDDAKEVAKEMDKEEETKKKTTATRTNVIDDSSSDEDIDADDSDDDVDDLELEIVGQAPTVPVAASSNPKAPSPSKASSALEILSNGGTKKKVSRPAPKRKNIAPGRATLRNALRAKQIQPGNKWLAR